MRLIAIATLTIIMGGGALWLSGHSPDSMAKPEATPPGEPMQRLPVSLNEIMVVLVNHSADPLWLAAWRPPEDDKAWRALERSTYQLQIAGSLLAVPGTGPLDDQWVASEKWQDYAARLRDAGERAVAAVAERDMAAISASGDEIVEICEACHIEFKPGIPTGKKYGELSPTADDFEKE